MIIRKRVDIADILDNILSVYYAATPTEDSVKQMLIQTRNRVASDTEFATSVEDAILECFAENDNFYPNIEEIREMFARRQEPLYDLLEDAGVIPLGQRVSVYTMECLKDGKEYFTLKYRGTKKDACRFSADLVISEMGDGDGENGGKGSLKNCIDEIAEYFLVAGNYAYADCIFRLREDKERK